MIFTCHAKRPETWALQKCLDAEVKTICVMCTITCVRHQQSILAFFFVTFRYSLYTVPEFTAATTDCCTWPVPLSPVTSNLQEPGPCWWSSGLRTRLLICTSLILCPNLAFAYSFSYSAVNHCLLHAESIVLGDGCEHGTAFRLIDVHI